MLSFFSNAVVDDIKLINNSFLYGEYKDKKEGNRNEETWIWMYEITDASGWQSGGLRGV